MRYLKVLLITLIGTAVQAQKKPNVVFILADDLGYHDLGYAGSTYYETPNIDGLAAKSQNFVNGYAASRVCSPSRAAIMTGKSPARLQITDWIGAKSGTDWRKAGRASKLLPATYIHELPQTETTIAEAFREEGYRTFFAGKWHLGDEGSHPEDHGFEINVGGYHAGSPFGGYFSPYKNPKMEDGENGENLSMRLANETADFISENKEKPFFAFLSFYAVHGPIQTTEEKWQKYQDKAKETGIADSGFEMERVLPIRQHQDNPVYAGLVETMDDAVGIVLKRLEALGLAENTIVVFTSDNGGVASGDAFSTSNAPLRGGKGYQWEGGIKEPFLIAAPGMAPKVISDKVIGMDFYPTLLGLAGLSPQNSQHVDGVNLMPLITNKQKIDRDLYWHYPHYGNQGGEPSSIIREGDWKLIHYWEDERNELYNLQDDPEEKNDLSKLKFVKADELYMKLKKWLAETKAEFAEQDPIFDQGKYDKVLEKYQKILLPKLEKERKRMLSDTYEPNADWWGSQGTED
ncbi:sulfatase [uncultured Arcticibacterium sp.]|uniref:sulfatase n=1 Tax=uncultured Arcticibacterium sp. TaxID=2173042 RepID=UPI0030F7EC86